MTESVIVSKKEWTIHFTKLLVKVLSSILVVVHTLSLHAETGSSNQEITSYTAPTPLELFDHDMTQNIPLLLAIISPKSIQAPKVYPPLLPHPHVNAIMLLNLYEKTSIHLAKAFNVPFTKIIPPHEVTLRDVFDYSLIVHRLLLTQQESTTLAKVDGFLHTKYNSWRYKNKEISLGHVYKLVIQMKTLAQSLEKESRPESNTAAKDKSN